MILLFKIANMLLLIELLFMYMRAGKQFTLYKV